MKQILIYRQTGNLGDAVQTIAMSRLLRDGHRGVFRDSVEDSDPNTLFVVNGWLGETTPKLNDNCLFAGVGVHSNRKSQAEWIGQSRFPVGSRDPFTLKYLADRGITSDLIGCATMTFVADRYTGPRTGRYAVDVDEPGTTKLKQSGRWNLWADEWQAARDRLDLLRRAEVVYTNRLHTALPCLGFGTPVCFKRSYLNGIYQPERLGLLDHLGFTFDEPCVMDLTPHADRYINWLSHQLGEPVTVGQPQYPVPA